MSKDVPDQLERLGLLGRLTAGVAGHPCKSLFLAAVISCVCVAITVLGLEFKSDRSDLISPNASFHQRWLEYCERFRETNELVILLEAEDEAELQRSRQWLLRELKVRSKLFGEVLSQSSLIKQAAPNRIGNKVDTKQLQQELQLAIAIQNTSDKTSPLLSLVGIANREIQNEKQVEDSGFIVTRRVTNSLEKSLQSIETSYQQYFPDRDQKSGHLWKQYLSDQQHQKENEANKIATHRELITVVALIGKKKGAEKYRNSLQELNHLMQAARSRFPNVSFGLTGIPELEHEEMTRSQSDMAIASLVSFGGVVILLLYGFHGLKLPIACCITLGVSMLWTLGLTTVLIGHLNILSMAFAAILVGLGIDFGVHLLSSYLEIREKNQSVIRSISLASDTVGKGIITAGMTTSIAFLCAGVTDFPGVAELGIIAGCGVLLCVLATFVVFPALVAIIEGGKKEVHSQENRLKKEPRPLITFIFLRQIVSGRPLMTTIMFLIPVVMLSLQAWEIDGSAVKSRVQYDANLLNMQPDNLPAVETQQRLLAGNQSDVLYAVAWYPSREEAISQAEKFQKLSTVSRVMELASQQMPGESRGGNSPEQSANQLINLLNYSEQLSTPPDHLLPHNPAQLGHAMETVLEQLKKNTSVTATQLRLQLDHFLETYSRQPFEVQIQILDSAEQELVRSLWSEIRMQTAEITRQFTQQHEVSQILKSRFVNEHGEWLLQIYPKEDIWSDEPLKNFVQQLRTVDPLVTGTPLQNYEASRQLKQSYTNAAVYAVIAIILVLMLDMTKLKTILFAWMLPLILFVGFLVIKGNESGFDLRETSWLRLLIAYTSSVTLLSLLIERRECLIGLLAILPPGVGALMLLGTMAIFDIPFTPANLIALPLVMGIGIDDGVHVIHDFKRCHLRYQMSANTLRALVLTSLTSMIGFGSLAIASHRGLAGLGLVVMIGIGSCLLVSIILLPAILSLFSQIPQSESFSDTNNGDRKKRGTFLENQNQSEIRLAA